MIIAREKEKIIFQSVMNKKTAAFVAVYGRRRIGKTYLIQQFFSTYGIYFECTGIKDGKLSDQLTHFLDRFQQLFSPEFKLAVPESWHEAFAMLTKQLIQAPVSQPIILFFDELPWLASRKSKFMQELDYYWNTVWSRMPNLRLIVCGSAASWMLDHLINAKGGLHNRITETILLEPFTLAETKTYLESLGFHLTHKQVVSLYMVMGGVPYYLNRLDKNKSIVENINAICFSKTGLLYQEFDRLFKSLFQAHEINLKIVRYLAKFRYGVSYAELVKKLHKKGGGRFLSRLKELESAGFIQKFFPFGKKQREGIYFVKDEYTLFYLNWIEPVQGRLPEHINYWQSQFEQPAWYSWAGIAFEMICYKHQYQIIKALKLEGACLVSHWRYIPSKQSKVHGAQIDMVIDRSDNAITLCEIKYWQKPFALTKTDADNLKNKWDTFLRITKTKKQCFMALIVADEFKQNTWSEDLINQVVTLDALFSSPTI